MATIALTATLAGSPALRARADSLAPADAATLRAFATSTTGTGNLHGWSDVAGTNLTGLAAADAICQARAAAAMLANPDDFVAWLSDRDDDAYCRVFGLPGKKANHCGLLATPVGAGPWLRTDDVPFASTIEDALANNRVYSTLNVDESGQRFFAQTRAFTATDIDGTFNAAFDADADCQRWTTANDGMRTPALGSTVASGGFWTFADAGAGCETQQRLICLQRGSAPALAGHGHPGRREAFVTSADVAGDLGGIDGADAVCRDLATAAHLYRPDAFKALLGASATANIADRFASDGPWYRRDGLLFAHDKAELTGGAVTLPLNVTESGEYLDDAVALIGAFPDGAPQPNFNCSDWTTTTGLAHGTLANSIALGASGGSNWLDFVEVSCAAAAVDESPHKLLCLSDADVVFHGEFEALPAGP